MMTREEQTMAKRLRQQLLDEWGNVFAVGVSASGLAILAPVPVFLTRAEAQNLAVWLAALAFENPQIEVPVALAKVLR